MLPNATSKANLVELRPDLSNYTDWEDMLTCYMRANECYHTVNPDDKVEKRMAELRQTAAGDDKQQLAKLELSRIKANAEALSIIRQWIHVSHRAKIRRCETAAEA